jgi:hypothetical protein
MEDQAVIKNFISLALVGGFVALAAHADVAVLERKSVRLKGQTEQQKKSRAHHASAATQKAKPIIGPATGSQSLIDSSGLKYFINTNITFSTSSSASGAMSEASYTAAVAATTSAGGTVSSTLNDAFDGYNTICLSLNNTVATCQTGNANFVIYNDNGPATTECNSRQIVFNPQVAGNITMQRKVFVPTNDTFARWMNLITNTSGSPQTVTVVMANNLGSDSNTRITATSTGGSSPFTNTAATWVATFQNYSGNTSSDPRLGHVFQGGGTVGLAGINFVDGDDNPFWGYTFTLAPGETKNIINFVTGQPSKAAAAAKAAELAGFPANAKQCMSAAEVQEVANFQALVIGQVPTLSPLGFTALGLGLVAAAFWILRRRQATAV